MIIYFGFDIMKKAKILEYMMQTIAVQIQDDYLQDFMNYVNTHSDSITIAQDKNSYRKI